jgi:hypothetical protein
MPVKAKVDTGQPGHLYFNEAVLIEIKTRKVPQNPLRPHEVATNGSVYGQGSCRLLSSHNISGYKPPTNCDYLLSRWPNKLDVDTYLAMMADGGLGEGAIVTRKHQPQTDAFKVHRWGVVMLTHKYVSSMEYKPYLVKWFSDGSAEMAWGEDLYVIHSVIDKAMIGDILESQGCDFGGAGC